MQGSIDSLGSIRFTSEAVWRDTLQFQVHGKQKRSAKRILLFVQPQSHPARFKSDTERERFYRSYAASISAEDWKAMERAEIDQLALPGNEQHISDNCWIDGSFELLEGNSETADSLQAEF